MSWHDLSNFLSTQMKKSVELILLATLFIHSITFSALSSAADASQPPFFPFGVYDKSDIEPGGSEWETYYKKLVNILVEHNFNTLVTVPYKKPEHSLHVLNLLESNGIKAILSTGSPLNRNWAFAGKGYPFDPVYQHPAVLVYKNGDEPHDQKTIDHLSKNYAAIRAHYSKPIVTAMIGEIMTGGPDDIALIGWKQLDSEIKFARFYPYRRTFDLVNWSEDKMETPFHEWCAYMETAFENRPWWLVAQTFGKGTQKNRASYWRLPTASEMNAMIHIALANGARGIVGWPLQAFHVERKPKRVMLLNQDLEPQQARDGSFPINQLGKLGKLIQSNAELLLRHKRSDLKLTGSDKNFVIVPRIDPNTGTHYLYIINQDAESSHSSSVIATGIHQLSSAIDIFSGRRLTAQSRTEGTEISYTLEPGEAIFVRMDESRR